MNEKVPQVGGGGRDERCRHRFQWVIEGPRVTHAGDMGSGDGCSVLDTAECRPLNFEFTAGARRGPHGAGADEHGDASQTNWMNSAAAGPPVAAARCVQAC